MKYLILDNLCKIEQILLLVYNDECSCNEGSLLETDLNNIIYCINQIRKCLEDKDENMEI